MAAPPKAHVGEPPAHNNAADCLQDADGQMSKPCDNSAPAGLRRAQRHGHPQGAPDNGPSWRFVHGPGLDDPLLGLCRSGNGLQKVYYWVTDGLGRHLAVADSTGYRSPADNSNSGIARWRLAGGSASGSSFNADRMSGGDVPKLSFYRNRAYDQTTGRWTQEDPIGIAGGLNLYQFNGNNPVMPTDPFGLSPWGLFAKTVKGAYKLIKRAHAKKILDEEGM